MIGIYGRSGIYVYIGIIWNQPLNTGDCSLYMYETTNLQKRRGVVRASVTRLGTRLGELEVIAD